VQRQNLLRLHRSIDMQSRHHFWWLFWPRGVTVASRLARAKIAEGAQRADDGGSSTDL
jgi:hypothetical protein